MVNSTFSGKSATASIAALYIAPVADNAAASVVLMSHMTFRNNSATTQDLRQPSTVGGVVLKDILCAAIVNSTFDSNTAASAHDSAGALLIDGLPGTPETCCQQSNTSLLPAFTLQPRLFDPLLDLHSNKDFQGVSQCTAGDIPHTTFSNNAGSSAGAMYLTGRTYNNITISYANFANNNSTAGAGGAILSVRAPDVFITQSTFSGQHSYDNGGAISVTDNNLIVNGSVIQSCSADSAGGAIAATRCDLLVTDSDVSSNTAEVQGGAVACFACTSAVFYTTSFRINTSHGVGGVLRADADSQVVSMELVEASGNK